MDHSEDDLNAMIANNAMLALDDYVKRGRRFETTPTDELKARWVATINTLSVAHNAADLVLEYEDLDAELTLRKVDKPIDEIQGALEALAELAVAATQDVEQRKRIDDQLRTDMALLRRDPDKPVN